MLKKRYQPALSDEEHQLLMDASEKSYHLRSPTAVLRAGGLMLAEMIMSANKSEPYLPDPAWGHEIQHLMREKAREVERTVKVEAVIKPESARIFPMFGALTA